MLALTISGRTEFLHEEEQETAMQRYWAARQSGDATAKLVQMDETVRAQSELSTRSNLVVSQLAQERFVRQEESLAAAGFSVPPPIYAPGTRVVALGEENFRIERERIEAMPLFEQAGRDIALEIQREEREDITVDAANLIMTDQGTLRTHEFEIGIEQPAFGQLATMLDFGCGTRYLGNRCSPELRALNVNAQLLRADRELVLRTRLNGKGDRSVYAAVTTTYASVDSHRVLDVVTPELKDAHAELLYDGNGVRGTALFMPDQIVDFAAGDVFKAGVRIETDDTGRGRIRISGVVWRNRCLNLIIIGKGEVETVSQVHRGDPDRILQLVKEGVSEARAKVGDFLEAWGIARQTKVEPEKLLRQWVDSRTLGIPGMRSADSRDAVVEQLLIAWRKEPGDTLADCVNALTRAAHETPDWDHGLRESLERRAGELVLVQR